MERWQKCPICYGTGLHQDSGTFNEVPKCTVCKGKKIINVTSGKPPQN